ncbi:hypothetical protein C5B42_02365 [Candidatus Cerribacteria bacterium 'Amazon FNV 2010 28 9']|uniref:Glycosyl transferase family 1 domain-containing protein n=1 Tax=Candidatus Cerribacteria bacterium 'Amazon FNV 2010 28 9' TaxID=2081795 RepID=A0A317JP86_9BACT|nr:MAG: hypothetical protein C5B42_02365 [Candidatus Cerribacteria bacterium 'Amazon FNV 2010 28 9']
MESSVFRVGVNAGEANVSNRVGSNTYAYKLLVELEKQTRTQHETVGPVDHETEVKIEWTIYLSAPPVGDMPKERAGWRYRVVTPAFLWTQWRLPLDLFFARQPLDVFLNLGHYAPRFCPYPSAVCVLDLGYLKFPQFFRKKDLYQLKHWTAYSVKQAKHIFTISQNSKKDIVDIYHINPADVSIVFPGIGKGPDAVPQKDVLIAEHETLKRYDLIPHQYIVSVGTIQPRKNMINAIKAFEAFKGEREKSSQRRPAEEAGEKENLKLVFVGKPGWLTKEFDDAVAASPVKNDIIVTGFVDEDTKYALLKHAVCSVLIGYYEGFGIPAIESLLYSVTPVVADTASLPEVVGEFGILVDPYNPEDIARGFEEAIEHQPDTQTRMQMREWAHQFSWETSAREMLHVLVDTFYTKDHE